MNAKKLTTHISAWINLVANEQTKEATTDFVTNNVNGVNSNIAQNHEDLAKQFTKDPEKLRLLLHEKTHHISFDSPVGLALSALAASCASNIFAGLSLEKNTLHFSKRDWLALIIVYTMMQPLIEGLAVFSENDAITRNSPAASKITLTTARLISPELMKWLIELETLDIWEAFRFEIQKQRMSENWTEQKIHLLSQSINGGYYYLLGYLAIKGIYRSLLQRCPKLEDSDLFILLMQDYWFSDYKYAAMLLNIERGAMEYQAVSYEIHFLMEYFWDRIENLYKNVNKYTKECENYFVGVSKDEPSYRNSNHINLEQLKILHAFRTAQLTNCVFFSKIISYRTVFRFSSKEVNIFVDESKKTTIKSVEGDIILSCTAVNNAMNGNYEGSIEGILYYPNNKIEEGKILNIISGGNGLVAIKDIETGTWNSSELVKYFDDFPSFFAIDKSLRFIEYNNNLEDFIKNDADFKEMYESYLEQNITTLENHFMQLAFRVSGEESKRLIKLLGENDVKTGFSNIFNEEQLKKVAKWSLLCGSGVWDISNYSDNEEILKEIDFINEIGKNKLGFDLFQCFKKNKVITVMCLI